MMAHPGFFLAAHPAGWIALGLAGYLAYRAGKSRGAKTEQAETAVENIEREGLADRMVKGAMKTAYRTRKKGEEVVSGAREKYASMWDEAQEELKRDKETEQTEQTAS